MSYNPSGEANGYYNQQPPQGGYYQQQPPPQQPYGQPPPQQGYGGPPPQQQGYATDGHEKMTFDQTFKVEKPKWNDLWAGILVRAFYPFPSSRCHTHDAYFQSHSRRRRPRRSDHSVIDC